MDKEELEKDFYKYLKDSSDYYDPREPLTDRKLLQMWLDCAEPREKRIADLEAQIEEMKCPQNCKNGSVYNWSDNSICMDCEKVRTLHEDNWQEMCKGCKYWELRR